MNRSYLRMYDGIPEYFPSLNDFLDFIKKFHNPGHALPSDWSWAQYDQVFERTEITGWNRIGAGSSRLTIMRPNRKWVLKIPRSDKGIQDNINESQIFKHRKGKLNPLADPDYQGALAPCRLVKPRDVPCLIMPLLDKDIYFKYDEHPKWCYQLCDGHQIGTTRRGKVVVYDYANEVYEPWSPEAEDRSIKYINDKLALVKSSMRK